jgi:hypothetical protein
MTKITQLDTEIMIAIAIVAVGGVKVTYAAIAARARLLVEDALKEPHSSQKRTLQVACFHGVIRDRAKLNTSISLRVACMGVVSLCC